MQANQIQHKATKVLFTGASGSGKTNAFIRFIYGSDYDTYFIFDHQGEILDRLNGKGLNLAPFYDFESITQYFEEKENEKEAGADVIIFDPSEKFEGIYEETFEEFCDFVFKLSKILPGKKLIAVDELQILTGNQTITRPLQAVLQTGRRRGLDLVAASQAPNELHNKIRNQITYLFAFRSIDARALQWIRDLQLPDFERLLTLPDGSAICFDCKTGTEDFLKINLAL